MFRSLFARMLITISTVLTVSFMILSVILANFANEYEIEKREADLERTAVGAVDILLNGFGLGEDGQDDLGALIAASPGHYRTYFHVYLSNTEETVLLLCDPTGKVLLSERGNTEVPDYRGMSLPAEVTEAARNSADFRGSADLFGVERRLLYTRAVQSGDEILGLVVTFSTVESFGGLTVTLIRTVLLASLWIILGALVILYLFCERVAGPLREMGNVTKSFAKGQFDRRVTVGGNDEVATLGLAFNQMADSLEQLETMRNSFISNVSHDLRTPMTTILGFIEGITSGAIPEEKHAYYLGVIAEEIRRLSRLVTELLDLSRLQSGARKFNFTNFDICEMARLILIANEQRIDEKHLEVSFLSDADNLLVAGDRDAIHQVLYNLCDNAIKFSREGGELRISITARPKRKIAVTVYNQGAGIPEADIPFVFDRFYKSDKSRSRDKTGAGLGLYISKTIIDAHGESLTLESTEGEFCAFTFQLPAVGD